MSATGHKAWQVHFVSPRDCKRARHKLGTYPAMTLAKARQAAITARQQVEDGDDPRGTTGTAEQSPDSARAGRNEQGGQQR